MDESEKEIFFGIVDANSSDDMDFDEFFKVIQVNN